MRASRLSVVLLTIVSACVRAPDENGAPESGVPVLEAIEVLRTGPELMLSIVGLLERDSSGRLIVFDVHEGIVVLSPDGRRIATIGGTGEGPGEYRMPQALQVLPGDTVLVFDRQLNRITTYDPTTFEPLETTRLADPADDYHPIWVRRLPGDTVRYVGLYSSVRREPDGEGPLLARILDATGNVTRDSALVLPTESSLVVRRDQAGGFVEMVTGNPYGATSLLRLGPDGRLYRAWTDSLAVTVHEPDGSLVRRMEATVDRRPVTDAQVDSLAEAMRERRSGGPGSDMTEPTIDALRAARPETWPVLWHFLVDQEGRAWIQLREGPLPAGEWAILGPQGREGTVRLPSRFRAFEIVENRVYGVEVDSLGVPAIAAYRIESVDGP